MLIALATLLALIAFAVLVRLLWLSARPGHYTTVITVSAAILVLALAALAATGRLNWLAAAAVAVAPFLKRGIGLLRFVPLLRTLGGRRGNGRQGNGQQDSRRPPPGGPMSRALALEILGLGTQPTREEVVAAHRHLIQKLHPDRGGSKYLAQQLNEAKARLLQDF